MLKKTFYQNNLFILLSLKKKHPLKYSKMKNKILLFLFAIIISSCKSTTTATKENPTEAPTAAYKEQMENINQANYFRAMGNEPEWSLKISNEKIVFTSLAEGFETFTAPHVAPNRTMDANVKMYHGTTALGEIKIQIQHLNCTNTMSGEILPYTVKVEITKNKSLAPKVFNGCGNYITDYRLHDIWVLETLNNKKAEVADFSKELPNLEINTSKNTFNGFSGCNRIAGSIFFENGLLRFTDIMGTKMHCGDGNKESEFLKALQSSTTYEIGNNRLTLSNPSGVQLVLKKVD